MSKANREKAGIQTASSHMAAELLSEGGMITFDSFSGRSSMVDTDDAISLKKIAKRDSSTREKALREIIQRCSERSVSSVLSTFSCLTSQFDKIIFDCSPIVRHLAMKVISKHVNILKKKAEKDLVQILPWIIFASCDPFIPCSIEASNFLSGLFSKEKIDEIMMKMSDKVLVIIEEVIVSRRSNLLVPSKLLNNDEEDSKEERMDRLNEQGYGVLVKFLKGDKREEAEKILLYRLQSEKKNKVTRGLLNAVSNCVDPVSVMYSCSFLDQLTIIISTSDQPALLPVAIDLILLHLTSTAFPLNEKEKKKAVTTILAFIKKCGVREWDSLGVRLLPLFSSLCSVVEDSARASFISNWFNALRSNGIPTKESLLYIGDCIKYVIALLKSPSFDETSTAVSMIFFLVTQSSISDPSSLHSLIIWTIPRLHDSKVHNFLTEVVRRCLEKLPTSRELLESLLSLHSPYLLFAWEELYNYRTNNLLLPIHLLTNAPDDHLISLASSIDLLALIEESGDSSLSPLYTRLFTLLPSSSLDRDRPMSYSSLVADCFSILDDEGCKRIVKRLTNESQWMCVEKWTKTEDSKSTIRLFEVLCEEEKYYMEKMLLSSCFSINYLAILAGSSEFSCDFSREVGVRVIKEYVITALSVSTAMYLSPPTRSVVAKLETALILHVIFEQVMKISAPLKVSSYFSVATLFYDLTENDINLLDRSVLFSEIIYTISQFTEELTHYSLLSHFWPCQIENIPSQPASSSDLIKQTEEVNKLSALFLALYMHRTCDSFSSSLLLSIIIFSSIIQLIRSSPLSLLPQSEAENELLEYSQQMIRSGCDVIGGDDILCLLSYSSPITRPLLIFSLRQLCVSPKIGAIPCEADTPFSALPQQGFLLHLEMARQLFYRRNVITVLERIFSYSQSGNGESCEELFTLKCDGAHFSLSMTVLTGSNEYMKMIKREGEESILSDALLDFLRCAIATALNSIHSQSFDSNAKDGKEKRMLLAAAAIQLANAMNDVKSEEWTDFFLPSITPIVLKIYGEVDVTDGSCLSNMVNMFIATHPHLEWDDSWSEHWDNNNLRFDMELDQAGISAVIQTLLVRASNALENGSEDMGEAIVAASRIIGMCTPLTISYQEENGSNAVLAPFMKNLADRDGWARCGLLVGCLSLLSTCNGESKYTSRVERSVLCDAMAPIISKCLDTIISKAERFATQIRPGYFLEKLIPSRNFFIHWLSYLLRDTFSSFPSIVKMWYTGLPKQAASLVNDFISSYLSPILIDYEITQVLEANLPEKHRNDQATLTIRRHANEILMDYILEDTRMRLDIQLPIGWPLLPPSISVEGSIVGVEDGRKWMLQLNSQLHRNASLASALSAWLIHAGKKVEGTECCTICMQLVAPQTKQLPKARCRTCHNKFHSPCLYKWFESSNQSSCPLCRTDFTAPP